LNTFDESIDIFESLANDNPKGVKVFTLGSWSIQVENEGMVVLVRSLLWPGSTFVHSRFPVTYSQFYYGTGQRNSNLGFML
jgi:radial spoke head protein 9